MKAGLALGVALVAAAVASCGTGAATPAPPPKGRAVSPVAPAPPPASPSAPPAAAAAAAPAPHWLKGSTHVHARPSGDATAPISTVVAWYQAHGYDFIVLTDHNQVSELDAQRSTFGEPAVSAPAQGLLVLAGIELTHNPATCDPPPPLPEGKCRIHVNALGVTARPHGKLEWAERRSSLRLDQYTRALHTARELGGLVQLNHPQWHWGMTARLLTELGRRGALLLEIANAQFVSWNAGDARFPSTEQLWDSALAAGVTLWGVASDDAHSYDGVGVYPAGGGWVMVDAAREPRAILAALAEGRFYSSTGVTLASAGRQGDALAVAVADDSAGLHVIEFVENGGVVERVSARSARRVLPARGTLRAVVIRADGARAWVQPVRR